LFFSFSLIFLV